MTFISTFCLSRIFVKGDNLRTEPKFITFLSQLLLLFHFCPVCKTDNPLVETCQVGTMVEVTTTCSNLKCPKRECSWRSQPNMPGTKMPAGNFLLCFAILVAGGSASKVFQIFGHMGLACLSLTTFFEHQRVSMPLFFPFLMYNSSDFKMSTIIQE